MTNSFTEENYLKAIYFICQNNQEANTNDIAKYLNTKASSATDMLKKLSAKKLVNYKKYKGVTLTKKGAKAAINIIRKHRLWEYFLVNKLRFKWDEVHEIAEQLEHIQSVELTNKLDHYLGHPQTDPHGDPIPDKNGVFANNQNILLSDAKIEKGYIVSGVKNSTVEFLQYVESIGISLGFHIKIKKKLPFDDSLIIELKNKNELTISGKASKNIFVIPK